MSAADDGFESIIARERGLRRSLSARQLSMIAIGGVIGAGLFVGSGAVITEAGPGAFLTYLVTGALIVLVMRMPWSEAARS